MKNIQTHLKIGSPVRVGNRIYFCNITFNGVFYLDIHDFTIHFVHKFSFEPVNAERLSKNASIEYHNAIYFFPNYTNVILKYDILKGQEKAIAIPYFRDKCINISGIAKRQDLVYIFPSELGKGIYIFDLKKEQVIKDEGLSGLFQSGFPCSSGHIIYDNKDCVWIGKHTGNELVKVNLITKQIVDNKKLEGMHVFVLAFDGSHYWILSMESTDIYEWDMENDFLQKYTNEHVEWRREDYIGHCPYSNLIFLEDEILVLNCYTEKILKINKEKKTIGEPIDFPEGFRLVNTKFMDWPVYALYTMLEDKVLLYPYAGNMLLIYDKAAKKMTGKDLLVTEETASYLGNVLEEKLKAAEEWCEDNDFEKLEYFTDMVKENGRGKKKGIREEIGKIILENLGVGS